jgi:hypothetical protein
MKNTLTQPSLIIAGFFGTVLALSTGCYWTCSCPPVEEYTFPQQLGMTLTDITLYDEMWNLIEWEDTSWSDVAEADLLKDGDMVTVTYTTDAGTFQLDLEASVE